MAYRSEALAIVDDRAIVERTNCRKCVFMRYDKPLACTNREIVRQQWGNDEDQGLANMDWFNRLKPASLRARNGCCPEFQPTLWERLMRRLGRSKPRRQDRGIAAWMGRLIEAGAQDTKNDRRTSLFDSPSCKEVWEVKKEAAREPVPVYLDY